MNSFPFAPQFVAVVYGIAVFATISGALIAVFAARIIRSVCGLAICCCGLAGLYYFLQSPFMTLMEVLIYVGAVCVTIIFAVMLSEPDESPPHNKSLSAFFWGAVALVISAVGFWGLSYLGLNHNWTNPALRVNVGSLRDIGIALLTTYSLAFELISVVLLIAILGALVIARAGRTKS